MKLNSTSKSGFLYFLGKFCASNALNTLGQTCTTRMMVNHSSTLGTVLVIFQIWPSLTSQNMVSETICDARIRVVTERDGAAMISFLFHHPIKTWLST